MTSPSQTQKAATIEIKSCRVWAFPGLPGETVELTLDRLRGRIYSFSKEIYMYGSVLLHSLHNNWFELNPTLTILR